MQPEEKVDHKERILPHHELLSIEKQKLETLQRIETLLAMIVNNTDPSKFIGIKTEMPILKKVYIICSFLNFVDLSIRMDQY
ncbi:hypothetical protein F4083_04435 [Candidatus Poribacteria bacterium]|nr:hypothetical protein [Candidatus Poribacteria bacterium]